MKNQQKLMEEYLYYGLKQRKTITAGKHIVAISDRNICYHIHGNYGILASCPYEAKRYFIKNELTGG